MTECPRFGKLFRGCRFEPRHDYGEPTLTKTHTYYNAADLEVIFRASAPQTYVRDICVTCGKTRERGQ